MSIISDLNWRASIKAFDPEKKLSEDQVTTLLEAFRLSASSYGLQLWKLVVVEDKAIREQLVEHSWNQRQVADASHLFVLCRLNNVGDDNINAYIQDIAQTRGQSVDDLAGYADMMKGAIAKRSQDEREDWMANQVYIALGTLLTTCAVEKIDSCPMEGFVAEKYNEILGLTEKNLHAQVVLPVGYRDEDDKYSQAKKVRFPLSEVIETI